MSPLSRFFPSSMRRRFAASRHASVTPSSLTSRIEVRPPQLWPSSVTLWGRMQRWLMQDNPWSPASARPVNRLALVKSEFHLGMDGLEGAESVRLSEQIERARSLRELWHLRSTLYGLLAVQRDQSEAERRLAQLNRHFPTRAPRSPLSPQDQRAV
ncbi:hypothetical protein [Ideonella sp. A 288]|uniref:hypothetical protein n=1 Tax=Ideonella sp. A 288 TaxID=1962181 RepID=UPI000B4A8D6C|nr:hypothetical protein [Ideonella sp. A 288]